MVYCISYMETFARIKAV